MRLPRDAEDTGGSVAGSRASERERGWPVPTTTRVEMHLDAEDAGRRTVKISVGRFRGTDEGNTSMRDDAFLSLSSTSSSSPTTPTEG